MSDDHFFNIDDLDSLEGLPENSVSDEELKRLLGYLDSPEFTRDAGVPAGQNPAPAQQDLEATTVTDLQGLAHGNTGTLPEDGATHVIPDEIRKIYDIRPDEPETPPAQPETEEYDARNYRAIHRNRTHRTGCLGGLLYFLFILCVSAVLALVGWIAANDVLALNKPDKTAVVVIPESFFTEKTNDDGETYLSADISEVADELKKQGFVDYPFLFKIFAKFSHADRKIDPGEYELSTSYDFRSLVAHMHSTSQYSTAETTTVTIPEGRTLKQTFAILEEAGVCDAQDLWRSAADTDFEFWFLSSDTLGDENRLEGFLFPDTYEFFVDSNPDSVLRKFLENFNDKFTAEMREAAEERGLTVQEIVTAASLIESEAANDEERPAIASVIYNRLGSSDMRLLQIDATIQYILPERKDKLTYDDLEIDSPYNTYLYPGLPPGAISNPGLASIKAAIYPEETDYFFYALNKEGAHSFFNDYYSFENFVNSSDFGG